MIRPESVFKIGHITKHRGLRGEVEMAFTDDCFDTGTADYLVLDMDGILVPFFWDEIRFKNDDTAIIKFADTDNEEQARRLIGHAVFYPKDCLTDDDEEGATLSSYKALTGFTMFDPQGTKLGTVEHVNDSSANILLTVESPDGKEFMIPYHDDFLVDFNLHERTLTLDFPEGLLDLN